MTGFYRSLINLYICSMAKLFIVGFPKHMVETDLVEMFSAHGAVNTVTIVTDKDTGARKGYGFITMTDDAGAERAITALDGTSIDGRTINVRIAEDKNTTPTSANTTYKKPLQAGPTPKPKRPRRSL
jgi:RNA recognition motif-containing protein